MCNPLALGIAAGGATAVTGIMQQNRQHRAQVDAVNRSNAIERQKYINDITISAYNDQRKGEVFTAQLQADAASRTAFYRQKELNQIEANRASESAQQELREKITESLFSSQENLAKSIQAQGTVLASGQQAGQSAMLTLDQAERELGFAQAQLDATREANRLSAYEPYERLGYLGSGIAQIASGLPGQYQSSVTPNPTPLQTALGIASVGGGLLGNYGDYLRGRNTGS